MMDSPDNLDEDEPKLSYERVLNDLSAVIQTDSITSACLHSKFIVIGTSLGRILVFDHQGNKVNRQELCVHIKSVNSISIDDKGEYIVSCSVERLVVYGLCEKEHNYVTMPDKPVNVVAIDPNFHNTGSGRRFVTGDDKVALYERGFLTKYKITYIQSKEQKVRTVSWYGQFIAWATDLSVQVFDVEQKSIITRIKRDGDIDEQDACRISWKDSRTLLIGWDNTIKVCLIKDRSSDVMNETQLRELPKKYVEIVSMFETDFVIHGLSPLSNNLLTLSVHTSERPQVRILEIFSNSFSELSKDLLTTRSDQSYNNRNLTYQLLSLHEEGIFFIVCPKDVISAKPRDHDDHFEWLVEHSMLKECYMFAKEHSNELVRHSLHEIEEIYINELLDKDTTENYGEAAKLCASSCGKNQEKWERAIKRFCDHDQLKQLLPYLPRCLKRETYDFVLEVFLLKDSVSFFKAIKEIPSDLYSLNEVTSHVIKCLANDPKNLVLNEALAELYTRVGRFEEAVNIYLDYNDKEKIFSLIRSNNLITILESRVDRLMQIDASETSQLLVENIDTIPMKRVVERLERYKSQKYLVSYLHRLILKDPDSCAEYHDLMVKLYAQHQRESLLNFLKFSTNYNLEEALEICKEFNLIKEVVCLLSRMGDLRVALKYIIESQRDIEEAIEFCKENQDPELWQDLILYSIDKPHFIGVLLKNIGTHISDPIDLIDRIPVGCEIEGLMPALVKILQDYQLQISLERSCRDLMAKDCFSLLEKQIRCQTQGIAIKEDQSCDHCNQPLMSDSVVVSALNQASRIADSVERGAPTRADNAQNSSNDIVVFGCHHVFHEECCIDDTTNQSDQEMSSSKTCRVCMLENEYDN